MKIEIPDYILYSCLSCGKCCSTNWQALVDEDKKENILAFAASKNIKDPFYVLPHSKNLAIKMGQKDRKSCLFLGDDKLCMIHKELGSEAQFLVCQTFPFKIVKTPGGYYTRMSFACTSVLTDEGRKLTEHETRIKKFIEKNVLAGTLEFPAHFNASATIDFETNKLLLAAMTDKLANDGLSKTYFIDVWEKLWSIALSLNNENRVRVEKKDVESVFSSNFSSEANAQLQTANAKKVNMYYSIFLGYELVGREEKNAMSKMTNLINLVRGKGRISSKYGAFQIEELKKINFNEKDTTSKQLLERYYRHIIESNWLMLNDKNAIWHPTVVNSWALLSFFYGIMIWFSKMFAYLKNRDEVANEDVVEVIRLVEINYISHTSRNWLFLDKPIFTKIFAQLVASRNFVPMILSPF